MVTMSQSEIDVAIPRNRGKRRFAFSMSTSTTTWAKLASMPCAASRWISSVVSLWPSWEQAEVANPRS